MVCFGWRSHHLSLIFSSLFDFNVGSRPWLSTQGFFAFLNKSVPGLERVEHIHECCSFSLGSLESVCRHLVACDHVASLLESRFERLERRDNECCAAIYLLIWSVVATWRVFNVYSILSIPSIPTKSDTSLYSLFCGGVSILGGAGDTSFFARHSLHAHSRLHPLARWRKKTSWRSNDLQQVAESQLSRFCTWHTWHILDFRRDRNFRKQNVQLQHHSIDETSSIFPHPNITPSMTCKLSR